LSGRFDTFSRTQSVKSEASPREGKAVYLGLGSNLGDREAYLRSGLDAIQTLAGCELIRCSSLYETAAWGKTDQPDFLNLVVQIETTLTAQSLLDELHRIEQRLGRERHERWELRTLDIDILLFGEKIIREPGLIVPHPYLAERRFVLVPLAEIAPDFRIPGSDLSTHELLQRCPDEGSVRLYLSPNCLTEDSR
jgi:2-amino-4-hydroxy-6-hydroxymethyldihydropteridine diphosphokinase